jgi:hypothetical protein
MTKIFVSYLIKHNLILFGLQAWSRNLTDLTKNPKNYFNFKQLNLSEMNGIHLLFLHVRTFKNAKKAEFSTKNL